MTGAVLGSPGECSPFFLNIVSMDRVTVTSHRHLGMEVSHLTRSIENTISHWYDDNHVHTKTTNRHWCDPLHVAVGQRSPERMVYHATVGWLPMGKRHLLIIGRRKCYCDICYDTGFQLRGVQLYAASQAPFAILSKPA